MRHTKLLTSLLFGTALLMPVISLAGPNCENLPVKTGDVIHVIRTPDQLVQTQEQSESLVPVIAAPAPVVSAPAANSIETIQTVEVVSPTATAEAAYTAVLQRRITRGAGGLNLFDYAGAKAAGEYKTIKAYTDYLASQNPDAMAEADQIAYWANLYNALTVNLILENYPVKSIRKIKAGTFSTGPWKRDAVTVNGQVLSLDTIEHKILRKRYTNPAMVHYMVNCASIGCPNLQPKLWDGATLEVDREAAAREFINSPRGIEIKGGKLKASSIYEWFKADFGGSKSATLVHVRKYAGPELRAAIDAGAKISGYGYNWDLNE